MTHLRSDGTESATTTYGYDVQDHLTSVTDAEGNVTTYVYSDRDLLTQQVSPVSGTTDFTYNEHGELLQEVDERLVTVDYTPDALDRVLSVDYEDDTLDVTYAYDTDPGSCAQPTFPMGRLTSITRGVEPDAKTVAYCYDRFGRTTEDGDLAYGYDANGNRTTIGYPSGVVATYAYDFADRQEALTVDDGVNPPQGVASGASYKPSGPLTSLELGNGITETRLFDGRYFPASIAVTGGALDRTWTHTTDGVGNITQIVATLGCKPADQTISETTLDDTEVFIACDTITLGPNVDVVSSADVTLQAGDAIAIDNGVSIGLGARLVAALDPSLELTSTWTFDYRDPEYYLTLADGPWGELSWTYDAIGNRLDETRDGDTDTYTYVANGASGNTPILESIALAVMGTRDYSYGAAGHLEDVTAGANLIDFSSDDAGRLAAITRLPGTEDEDEAILTYDGRGFLCRAENAIVAPHALVVEPSYNSEGLLYGVHRQILPGDPELELDERFSVFYFAGRPLAQLRQEDGQSEWRWLTTDHLGTPLLATNASGVDVWSGPLEPFGEDFFQGASRSDVFLRLPGQWTDTVWAGPSMGADVYYNVHRWYEYGTGRYSRPDPLNLGVLGSASRPQHLPIDAVEAYYLAMLRAGNPEHEQPYLYGVQNPLLFSDPLGLFGPGALGTAGGACVAVDGPLPIGDVIGIPLLIGAAAWAATDVIKDWWDNRDDCEECDVFDTCRRLLDLCLANRQQPEWNRPRFGRFKDCGACFRNCRANEGGWPFDKCPLP